MKIYVLPISGGGFVSQLGLLAELYDATNDPTSTIDKGTPDLVLSSSGGNVAAYLAMVSGWSSTGIMHNIRSVKSGIFVQPWTPPFLPTWLMFPFTQSIYRNGSGMDQLFTSLYTPRSITQTEIWTGTYNATSQRCGLFCNLGKDSAFVKDDLILNGTILYDADEFKYLDGDTGKIAKAVYASAAIPFVTEGIYIGKDKYVDGGLSYSSPLIPISDHLKVCLDRYLAGGVSLSTSGRPLIQMFYFCSYDMDSRFSDSMYTKSIGLLIHSSGLQDRAFARLFLQQFFPMNQDPKIYASLNSVTLRAALEEIKDLHYIVFLYPHNARSINVADFTAEQLKEYVEWTKKNYGAIIWTSKI